MLTAKETDQRGWRMTKGVITLIYWDSRNIGRTSNTSTTACYQKRRQGDKLVHSYAFKLGL